MKLSGDFQFKLLMAGVVLIGAGFVLYRSSKIGAAVVNAVNPFNNENIINEGATALYRGVTGSEGTIGTDVYDYLHPEAARDTNVINGAYTSFYQSVTGSKGSIGTDLYDWWNK